MRYPLFIFHCFASFVLYSQSTIKGTLERYNDGSVPYIEVGEMAKDTSYVLLDARENEEFAISKIPKALFVGHERFNPQQMLRQVPEKDTPIVVYCSVGVRSEAIGEKLQEMGYTQVKNLYGGIFEWKNQGHIVVDSLDMPTEKVHTYSKEWSKLLTKGQRIY